VKNSSSDAPCRLKKEEKILEMKERSSAASNRGGIFRALLDAFQLLKAVGPMLYQYTRL